MILDPKITNTRIINRFNTIEDEAMAVHPDCDYSNSIFSGMGVKMWINCLNGHSPFKQTPTKHVTCGQGCPLCADANRNINNIVTYSQEEFSILSEQVHGIGVYGYDSVKDTHSAGLVLLFCIKCDKPFTQRANVHLSGHGCIDCGFVKTGLSQSISQEEVLRRFRAVHGTTYGYDKVIYDGYNKVVSIFCYKHNRYFLQTPGSHIAGNGCPDCAEYGFSPSKPAILYYLRVETRNQICYKIGITNRSVEERYQPIDLNKINIVAEWSYKLGSDALAKEQEILKQFSEFQYCGSGMLQSGNTELFTIDVLELDK